MPEADADAAPRKKAKSASTMDQHAQTFMDTWTETTTEPVETHLRVTRYKIMVRAS